MPIVNYVNLAKAAKLSDVSVTKLYRFIHSGDLAVYKKDGVLVVRVQDLMKQKSNIKDCELLEPTFMNIISEVK
ncbi:MAG: helix-turn-helix domain-containing protein, partial [Gammaproteobacteria bacterium]